MYLCSSNRYKSPSPSNDQAISNSSQVENNVWKEKQLYLSEYLHKKSQPLSCKTMKYPFMNNSELKMCYRNLYHSKNTSHLECDDAKYQLTPDEILEQVSVQFTLKLCNVIAESMSVKC